MKGQAALFDGIFFLIIVMGAVGMLFQFVYSYGQSQDNALRSAYILDFTQSFMKSIYYVDVGSVKSDLYSDAATDKCADLAVWAGSGTVAECIKLDAEDGRLDNVGASCGKVGLTSLRCLLHESMKPFVYSGYSYTVEMRSQAGTMIAFNESASNKGIFACDNVNASEIIAVSTPFRILKGGATGSIDISKLTVCLWAAGR